MTYKEQTYIGKITVIKTLTLRILIQSLTVLTNPPEWVIKEIQDNFYNFLWNGKNDKIEGTVMINDYEEQYMIYNIRFVNYQDKYQPYKCLQLLILSFFSFPYSTSQKYSKQLKYKKY